MTEVTINVNKSLDFGTYSINMFIDMFMYVFELKYDLSRRAYNSFVFKVSRS